MPHVPTTSLPPAQAAAGRAARRAGRRSAVQRRASFPGLVGRFRDEHRREPHRGDHPRPVGQDLSPSSGPDPKTLPVVGVEVLRLGVAKSWAGWAIGQVL